ncbi:SUMF1/EgtB/PvdO family nonheme iron enzyme [Treponema sp. R6D11]
MKRNLIFSITILILIITSCKNPFLAGKDEIIPVSPTREVPNESTEPVIDIDTFEFIQTDITKTYGSAVFTNAVAPGYSGSGAITYSSDDETVALVNNSGQVTILKVGSVVITAEKEADEVYSLVQASYTLTVTPKPVTITGLSVNNKVYDGTTAAAVKGVAIISGKKTGDDLKVSTGIAEFEDANPGIGKIVTFSGFSLTGDDAGNYILSAQPVSVMADITVNPLPVVVFNSNGGSAIPSQSVTVGNTATRPLNPSRAGYTFDYWYENVELTIPYYFGDLITDNKTLYAKWVSNEAVTQMEAKNIKWIAGGTFLMGSPASEPGRDSNEGPQHSVTLNGFFMGKYQVTQAQWETVMGRTIVQIQADATVNEFSAKIDYGRGPNYPIYYINWYDTLVFCNKLSVMEGLSPAYSINGSTDPADWGPIPYTDHHRPSIPSDWDAAKDAAIIVPGSNGYRLPTEAQWEYACRAGTTTAFYDGNNDYKNTALLKALAWYHDNREEKAQEVNSKPPNPWGLYGMYGNVSELCWDWYYANYYTSATVKNPMGPLQPNVTSSRVSRGGSWLHEAAHIRSAYRDRYAPHFRHMYIGFRIVRPYF